MDKNMKDGKRKGKKERKDNEKKWIRTVTKKCMDRNEWMDKAWTGEKDKIKIVTKKWIRTVTKRWIRTVTKRWIRTVMNEWIRTGTKGWIRTGTNEWIRTCKAKRERVGRKERIMKKKEKRLK